VGQLRMTEKKDEASMWRLEDAGDTAIGFKLPGIFFICNEYNSVLNCMDGLVTQTIERSEAARWQVSDAKGGRLYIRHLREQTNLASSQGSLHRSVGVKKGEDEHWTATSCGEGFPGHFFLTCLGETPGHKGWQLTGKPLNNSPPETAQARGDGQRWTFEDASSFSSELQLPVMNMRDGKRGHCSPTCRFSL